MAMIGIACVATLSVGFINITPKVIYGDDNRLDVYEVSRADVRDIADSTVALIPTRLISPGPNGSVLINGKQYGSERNLCPEEPFFDQPSAANCSGSLVGEDLIATAGHCVSPSDCNKYVFVFGYKMINSSMAQVSFPQSEVYKCKEIVAREYTNKQDYALVRLDRPVHGHRVLSLQQAPVQAGDGLYVVGHPSGLPTKVADGANVRLQQGPFFTANLDTYGGNSGSAVFNARTNEVVGILVRGAADFIYDKDKKCSVSNKCASDLCRGEDVTNISYIVQALSK